MLAHRGIVSARIVFQGQAGHASAANALELSAVHQAMRWGVKSLDHVASLAHSRFGGLTGLRFNIGRDGGRHQGQRDRALGRVALRLPAAAFAGLSNSCIRPSSRSPTRWRWRSTRRPSAVPRCLPATSPRPRSGACRRATSPTRSELPVGNAVDFWTEASLFSAAGLTAFVYGPGDIAQAHSADEWVALEQLATVSATYLRLMSS